MDYLFFILPSQVNFVWEVFFDTPIVTFSLSSNHFAVAFYANDSSAESKLLSPCTLSARQTNGEGGCIEGEFRHLGYAELLIYYKANHLFFCNIIKIY